MMGIRSGHAATAYPPIRLLRPVQAEKKHCTALNVFRLQCQSLGMVWVNVLRSWIGFSAAKGLMPLGLKGASMIAVLVLFFAVV
jgi:hypothetical protein